MINENKIIRTLQNRIDTFIKNHPEQKDCKEVQSIKEIIQMLEQEAAEYKAAVKALMEVSNEERKHP